MSFNGNASVVESLTTLNQFGQPLYSQQYENQGGNWDATQANYDVFLRPSQGTMPCVTTSTSYTGSASGPCPTAKTTTSTFDALGRVTQTEDGALGYVQLQYNQNDVLQIVGPSPGDGLKEKQSEYDGIGRLTSVCEYSNGTGSAACGQSNGLNGYLTTYGYTVNSSGNPTMTVTQNALGTSTQTRVYTYDLVGRLLSEQNPENGTVQYFYDTDPGAVGGSASCATVVGSNWHAPYNGDLVKKYDANGNTICYTYDAMHRLTSVTYAGTDSGNTPTKTFVYDSASFNGTAMSNSAGQMVEAYTGSSSSKTTDEFFSYSARGELTDTWQCSPHSGTNGCASTSNYYHVANAYWENGALKTLSSSITGVPTQNYGVDPMGRIKTVSASSGQNPVTGTTYNLGSFTTTVNFGSGDSDVFTLDSNTGRLASYQFNMGSYYDKGQLTWNQNGTLGALAITDTIPNTQDSQTCNYTHDEFVRVASVNCTKDSTTKWTQSFTYDVFGNITKASSGPGISFQSQYDLSKNWLSKVSGTTTNTDPNGRLKYDGTHNYTWDSENRMVTVDSTNVTYDALGRMVEKGLSGVYTQVVYGPQGRFALMNGQTLVKAFIPLPQGATAVYTPSGLAYYRHSDHLGSSRLATTPSRTLYASTAYAPFGEVYAQSGSVPDVSFTGQDADTVPVTGVNQNPAMYDFLYRKNSPVQGRWLSPDPAGLAAANPADPQSWNRYSYVSNNPLLFTDPLGLFKSCTPTQGTVYVPGNDDGTDCPLIMCPAGLGWGVISTPSGSTWVCGSGSMIDASVMSEIYNQIATEALFISSYPAPVRAGRNCTVGGASKLQYAEAAAEVAAMTAGFFSGIGAGNLTFDPNSATSQVMAQSGPVQEVLDAYYMTGQPSGLYTFGPPGLVSAGDNPVAQFVGSFRWSITPANGGINLLLTNTTSFRSLTYDTGPQWQRGNHWYPTPMGNTHQTYNITATCQ